MNLINSFVLLCTDPLRRDFPKFNSLGVKIEKLYFLVGFFGNTNYEIFFITFCKIKPEKGLKRVKMGGDKMKNGFFVVKWWTGIRTRTKTKTGTDTQATPD